MENLPSNSNTVLICDRHQISLDKYIEEILNTSTKPRCNDMIKSIILFKAIMYLQRKAEIR